MSEKMLEFSVLLDHYGELLCEKQRIAARLYFDEDLSLSEIAENMGMTRQGVHDHIKNAQTFLLSCEKALGLAKKTTLISEDVEKMKNTVKAMSGKYGESIELSELARLLDDIDEHGI